MTHLDKKDNGWNSDCFNPELEPTYIRPSHIDERHWREFEKSAIAPELAAINFRTLGKTAAEAALLYSKNIPRTNTGRVDANTLRMYAHLYHGSWGCGTIDPLNLEPSLWGCCKPDNPRLDQKTGKPIKYEHPYKEQTQVFCLRATSTAWELVSERSDTALPENFNELKKLSVDEFSREFWQWVRESTSIPIIICEGSKKAACLLSYGFVAIALPGINGGYRQPKNELNEKDGNAYLVPQLGYFANKGREFCFYFDQDEKTRTIRAVNGAIYKTAKLIFSKHCRVTVATWDKKLGKGIDDVVANYSSARLDLIFQERLGFRDWSRLQARRITHKVAIELNERYLPDLKIPRGTKAIFLKAPKGTGKTTFISRFVEPYLKTGERKILVLTHRIQLGKAICDALGVPYLTDSLLGNGFCIDSLHEKSQVKFKVENWTGAIVIIDEIMQLIDHVLNSTTCTSKRVVILKNLAKLIKHVVETGGKIVCSDADLNDTGIDFVMKFIGNEVEPFIIENNFKHSEPWTIHNYLDKDSARLLVDLIKLLGEGKRVLVCCSGQKEKSLFGTTNLELYINALLPGLKTLRIDSATIANKKHEAFGAISRINDLNFIHQYDVVLASTTIGTGVSIEKVHFDAVFGIFSGVQSADEVRQHLARYRPPVDRFVWLAKTGSNLQFIGNGSSNPQALKALEYKRGGLIEKKIANYMQLQQMEFEEDCVPFDDIFLETWAKIGANKNAGYQSYRESIVKDWIAEGHIVEDDLPQEDVDVSKDKLTETRDINYNERNLKISKARDLSYEEFKALKDQPQKTDEERYEFEKASLSNLYSVPVTPELIVKHDDGWHSKIQRHYFHLHPELIGSREFNTLNKAIKNGEGSHFLPDSNSKSILLVHEALELMPIKELLTTELIHESHPLAIKFGDHVRKHAASYIELRIDLSKGKQPKDIKNMAACHAVVKVYGLKFPRIGKTKVNKKLEWVYGTPAPNFEMELNDKGKEKLKLIEGKPIPVSDGREQVFEAWLQRSQKDESEVREGIRLKGLINQYWDDFKTQGLSAERVSQEIRRILCKSSNMAGMLSEEDQAYNQKIEELLNRKIPKPTSKVAAPPQEQPKQLSMVNTSYQVKKAFVVEQLPEPTPENALDIANQVKSPEEAVAVLKAAEPSQFGEILHLVGLQIRKSLLDTGKYLHEILRDMYRSCYECFDQGIEVLDCDDLDPNDYVVVG